MLLGIYLYTTILKLRNLFKEPVRYTGRIILGIEKNIQT